MQVLTHTVDVVEGKSVDAWIQDVVKTMGRIDGAANTVGGQGGIPDFASIEDEMWRWTMDINLTGAMNCMRAELRHLAKPGGSIVNVSSAAGSQGLPNMGAYVTAKWGLRGMAR